MSDRPINDPELHELHSVCKSSPTAQLAAKNVEIEAWRSHYEAALANWDRCRTERDELREENEALKRERDEQFSTIKHLANAGSSLLKRAETAESTIAEQAKLIERMRNIFTYIEGFKSATGISLIDLIPGARDAWLATRALETKEGTK